MPKEPPGTSSISKDSDAQEACPVRAGVWKGLRDIGRFLRRHWIWGIVIGAGVLLWQDLRPEVTISESGPSAPTFQLEQMNGETFQLSDHRGEIVVLNVWATWCDPCHTEVPSFVELQKEFADEGVTFVGLSINESGFEAVRPFARRYDLNYPQVASPSVAWEKYGQTRAVPRTFVIDRQGRIRYRHTGLLLKGRLNLVLEQLTTETTASR